jgi:uncharacterized RDD family membrane protein YckC
MKAISEFVVHVFDLIEAEGSALRTVVQHEAQIAHGRIATLVLGVAVLAAAVPLVVSGLWLLGAALFWWLEHEVGSPLAAAITGLLVLGSGLALVAGFGRTVGKRQ